MTRTLRLIVVFALIAGGGLAFATMPAQAATSIDSGWWWRANAGNTVPTPDQAPLVIPLPTTAPAPPPPPNVGDNLLVAATLDGPSAVAAVRAVGAGGTLVLTVADNSAGTQVAKLRACKTTGQWTPVQGGRWDDKPGFNCDAQNSAAGTVSSDGKVFTFAVAPLLTDGALDVVIVATPTDPTTGATAPFELVFSKPAPAAFGTTASQDTASADFSSDFKSDFNSDAPADFAGSTSTFDSTATDDTTTFDETTTFAADTPSFSGAPSIPLAPRKGAAAAKTRVFPLQQTPASVDRKLAKAVDDSRGFALVIVLLALAGGYFVSQRQSPAIHGLGRVAIRSTTAKVPVEPVKAGLGRFGKVRTKPPSPLF